MELLSLSSSASTVFLLGFDILKTHIVNISVYIVNFYLYFVLL